MGVSVRFQHLMACPKRHAPVQLVATVLLLVMCPKPKTGNHSRCFLPGKDVQQGTVGLCRVIGAVSGEKEWR